MMQKITSFFKGNTPTKGSSTSSVSSAPRASVSSAPVKTYKLVNCYIQKKDGTFVNCRLNRDNDGEFHKFDNLKQIIFRQCGNPDLFLLVKTIPTFDQIKKIAATNGFKTPIGLQTIEEIDGGIKTNTFIFNIHTDFGEELKKYYVIFEGDGAVVTLNLGLSFNDKDVFIDQHLTKVEQTLFLQMGRIKYILQFGKPLTWDQLEKVLSFKKIIGDNQVSRVVGQEYYNNNTDESSKEFYICTGGSIWFDCGFIELTKKLEHRSNLLSLNNSICRKEASRKRLLKLQSLFRRCYFTKLKKDASSTLTLKRTKYRNEEFCFKLRRLKHLFICYIAKSKSTTIQACFRGYRSRKQRKNSEVLPNGSIILGFAEIENNSVKKEEEVKQTRKLSQQERLLLKKTSGKELWGGK